MVAAYGFKETTLKQIYHYVKNRRQCVGLNNAWSDFKDIIYGL